VQEVKQQIKGPGGGLSLIGGVLQANGSGRQQAFQSLHDIRLVKSLLSPEALNCSTPRA